MHLGGLDLVQRMRGGDQDLLRHAAPVGTGAAEVSAFDEGDFLAGLGGDGRNPESRVAAADDDDVVSISHVLLLPTGQTPGLQESSAMGTIPRSFPASLRGGGMRGDRRGIRRRPLPDMRETALFELFGNRFALQYGGCPAV